MALSGPRYALEEKARRGHRDRIWSMFVVNFRLRAIKTLVIIFIVLGFIATLVPLLINVFVRSLFGGGSTADLSAFFIPFSGFLLLIFILLLTALVGGGIVSDDLGNKSISLYLSRPITLADYLAAKGCVVAATLGLIAVVPGVLTTVIAFVLGYVSATVALEAFAIFLGIGVLLTATFASIALFLSSLSERRTWASSGIFAALLFDFIVANVISGAANNVNWLYMSPWDDIVSVARALFGATAPPHTINPLIALGVLVALVAGLVSVTYVRLSRMELVTE
jgi:ABC-2 type transport system permease protein